MFLKWLSLFVTTLLFSVAVTVQCLAETTSRNEISCEKGGNPSDGSSSNWQYCGRTLATWMSRLKDLDEDSLQVDVDLPALIQILNDQSVSGDVRVQVAYGLSQIGAKGDVAIPHLVSLMDRAIAEDDGDDELSWVVKGLGYFGPRAEVATSQLIALADDDKQRWDVRSATLEPLAAIGSRDGRVIPALIRLMSEQSQENAEHRHNATRFRANVAETIGMIGADANAAIPTLLRQMDDPDLFVRRNVMQAIGKMGAAADIAKSQLVEVLLLDPAASVRDEAGIALASIGPTSLSVLKPLSRVDDREVQHRVAKVYNQMGIDAAGAEAEIRTLATADDLDTQLAALEALWKICSDRDSVIPQLISILDTAQRHHRFAASRLIKEIGDLSPHHLAAIKELSRSENLKTRTAAKHVLRALRKEL